MQDYCLSKEGGADDTVTNKVVCQDISSYVKDLSEEGVNFEAWRVGDYKFCGKWLFLVQTRGEGRGTPILKVPRV